MIWWLGKRFRFVRKFYYKLTGKYLWGVYGMIHDEFMKHFKVVYPDHYEDWDEIVKQIFDNKPIYPHYRND